MSTLKCEEPRFRLGLTAKSVKYESCILDKNKLK